MLGSPIQVERSTLTYSWHSLPIASAGECSGRARNQDGAPTLFRSPAFGETEMQAFIRRFLMHYGIYRRYPLGRLPALRNAWRTARA
jgi:hypothetical protein